MLFLCVFVFVLHGSDVNEVNADVKLSVYPSIIFLTSYPGLCSM